MEIKILGTGCPRCNTLEEVTRRAVESLNTDATITKVNDIIDILGYGVRRTPALVINNEVVVAGRVPDLEELKKLITTHERQATNC